jgi:hypothetical protein
LYNFLQDITQTKAVLDLRPLEDYEKCHVRTATHVSIVPSLHEPYDSKEALTKFIDEHYINSQLRTRGLLFKKIIIYGPLEECQKLVQYLLKEGKPIEKIFIVQDVQAFFKKYPFLCSSKTVKAFAKSFPAEIIENRLYLGSFENASSEDQLEMLGITSIVNMATELENVFEGKTGLKYLKLGIHDTVESSVRPLFDEAYSFIGNLLL